MNAAIIVYLRPNGLCVYTFKRIDSLVGLYETYAEKEPNYPLLMRLRPPSRRAAVELPQEELPKPIEAYSYFAAIDGATATAAGIASARNTRSVSMNGRERSVFSAPVRPRTIQDVILLKLLTWNAQSPCSPTVRHADPVLVSLRGRAADPASCHRLGADRRPGRSHRYTGCQGTTAGAQSGGDVWAAIARQTNTIGRHAIRIATDGPMRQQGLFSGPRGRP
jgi:hypothetical protein